MLLSLRRTQLYFSQGHQKGSLTKISCLYVIFVVVVYQGPNEIDRQLDRARRGEPEALSSLYRTHSFYKGGNHAPKASFVVAENTNSSVGWE